MPVEAIVSRLPDGRLTTPTRLIAVWAGSDGFQEAANDLTMTGTGSNTVLRLA